MAAKIGELNGKWAFLLKLSLSVFPVFLGVGITWASWVTTRILTFAEFKQTALTASDADKLRLEFYHSLNTALVAVKDVPRLESRLDALDTNQRQMKETQIRTLTIIEQLERRNITPPTPPD